MMTFKEQYYKIIHYRQAHPLEDGVYGENHHIYPKSLFPQFARAKWNIVKLTPQEHFECHELLVKWFEEEGDKNGYEKMVYALNQISHTRKGLIINAEQYAEMKERFYLMCKGKHLSDETKKKLSEAMKGKNHPLYGKQHSDETKKKLSEAMKDKYNGENNPMFGKNPYAGKTDEEMAIIKQMISEASKRRKHSDATKRKIGEAHKKPFEIDGIKFERQVDAAKHFGVSKMTIYNWLNGKTNTEHIYKYL